MSNNIHITLMGKGGIGKSLVSSFVAQYLRESGAVLCIDTDPTNQTFCQYEELGAKHVNILTPELDIDKSLFDELIEEMLQFDGDCVIDNGGSSFFPMMSYIIENDIIELLESGGKSVIIHTVLIGGQGMNETFTMIEKILHKVPAKAVVWQNEFFGPVVKNNKTFIETTTYARYQDRIKGIVTIAARGKDTFGKNMNMMTERNMTFNQVQTSSLFSTVPRQRLKIVQRAINEQLEAIL